MNRPRVDAALLEETAEDLYEHAPCGYLSTLPDGRITFTPTRNGGPCEGFIDLREQSLTAEEPDDPVVALLAAFDAST